MLLAFPYTDAAQTKKRPALVLLDAGDADLVVARVTTHPHQTPYDVRLLEWQAAGLLAPSVVRLHKVAALEKTLVERVLGRLHPRDRQAVADTLRKLCADLTAAFSSSSLP